MLRIAGVALAGLAFVVFVAGIGRAQDVPDNGSWTIQTENGDKVNFELRIDRDGDHSSWGNDVPLSQMPQLSHATLESEGADVRFNVVRDAGTLQCAGHVAHGQGGGTFHYLANPQFASALAARGVAAPNADEQRRMTYSDVSLSFVDALRRYHYAPPTPESLIRLTDHGVTEHYLAALDQYGYHPGSAEDLVRMVDHGVTAEFIGSIRGLGYQPSTEDLVRMVDHGVTTDFARTMISLGYHPTTDQLVRLVDHGVTADFVKHLRARGYTADIDQLIRLCDAGL